MTKLACQDEREATKLSSKVRRQPERQTPPLSLDRMHACMHAYRCYKNVFYLVTLVYPRCAQTCLQLFSMTKLDIGTFLAADFTILVRDTAGHWGKVSSDEAIWLN